MAKIEYTQCDICKQRIEKDGRRRAEVILYRSVDGAWIRAMTLDVHEKCMRFEAPT